MYMFVCTVVLYKVDMHCLYRYNYNYIINVSV